MKKIFIWILCVICLSCQEDNNLFDDIVVRGGFVQFSGTPELRFNLLEFESLTFANDISDPNNNATSYSLALTFETLTVENFVTVNTFPATLTFTGDMLLDATGLTVNDITPATEFRFVATVTTPTGTFTGSAPSFNTSSNTEEGGNTAVNLFRSGLNDAMDFTMTFFVPPPRKLRGTSFEEPFAAPTDDADYIRTGGADDEGELLNNDGQRHVMHVAAGPGVDDEIGFRSEFFSNGSGGFTNEEIGVTRKTADVGSYVDGVQGFQLEDVDGLFRLTFDKVDIPDGNPRTGVRIQVFFRETSWEDNDTIRIYAEIERSGGMETLELMSANGAAINAMEGRWNLADSGFLDDVTSYTLIIDSEINSGSEEIYFDEMLVYAPDE